MVSPYAYGASGLAIIFVNAKSTISIPAISESSESVAASSSPGVPVPFPWIAGSVTSEVIASLGVPNSPPASLVGSVSNGPSLSAVTGVDTGGFGPGPSGSVTVFAPAISAVFTYATGSPGAACTIRSMVTHTCSKNPI